MGVSLKRSTGVAKLFLNEQEATGTIMPPNYAHQTSGPIRMGRVKIDGRFYRWVLKASRILIIIFLIK